MAMCCVKVGSTSASFEYSNGFLILHWKISEKGYESDFVIDLVKDELLQFTHAFVGCTLLPSIQAAMT